MKTKAIKALRNSAIVAASICALPAVAAEAILKRQ